MDYEMRGLRYQAFQWTADIDQTDDPVWLVEALKEGTAIIRHDPDVHMMLGAFRVEPGMYIVRNDRLGHIYPCPADFFERNFTPVRIDG